MPSCVVKTCRNHSGFIKKNQGITFHRFPSANELWKEDWIGIIRKCRNENNWNPSKSSVICSNHFEANDIYTTKGGLLRIVTYAVPKKLLFESSSHQQQPSEGIIVSASFKLSEPYSIQDHPAEVNNSSDLHLMSPIKMEIDPLASCSEHEVKLEQTCSQESTASLQQISHNAVTPPASLSFEQPLSVLYTPINRRLKENLMKMHILTKRQMQKIKILNQKIRRLQNRNKRLKVILKTMREDNYIDVDLFNKLNENIVATEFFNIFKRKKLKREVKFSPSMKKFCITLNYYSPKAYDYLRQTFNTCLPHRKTLYKWYRNFKGELGFTEESFQDLKA